MDDTQIIDLYWDRDQGAITATRREVRQLSPCSVLEYPPQPSRCRGVRQRYLFPGLERHAAGATRCTAGLAGADHPEPVTGPLEGRADPKPGRGYGDAAGGTGRVHPRPSGTRSRRRRSGFWRNVSARFCGDRRRITGISSCGAIGTARISPPSQSVWIAARAG